MEEDGEKDGVEVDSAKLCELYKIAIETRQLEIQLFWQRSNYFLVLNTAVAAAYFSVSSCWHSLILAIFGVAVSALWLLVNFGSKYWQVRWEAAAERLEKQFAAGARMFSASPEQIQEEVEGLLRKYKRTKLQALFDPWILKKPSVSTMMIYLAVIFELLWIVLAVSLPFASHCR